MKKTLSILLILVMVFSLAACGDNSENENDGKILKVAVDYEMDSLDPARALDDVSFMVINMVYEPLLRYIDGESVPGGAASWEATDDNMEYTFHLQENAVFSNGEPITAKDYEYAIMRALNPETSYPENAASLVKNGEKYYNGECGADEVGVEVIDDYTLKIVCEYPTFPISFAEAWFIPLNQAAVESFGETYGAEADQVVTNGAFTMKEWTHESKIVVEKNADYWDAANIKLDGIEGYINAYDVTASDMLTVGELDVANTIYNLTTLDDLEQAGFQKMTKIGGWQFLHMSYKGASEETAKWLNNKNFRLALSYSLDRENLRNAVYKSDQPATRFVLESEKGSGDQNFVDEYPYEPWGIKADTAKAQEYLKLAMKEMNVSSADEIPTFTMLTLDSEGNMDALNAIADMWLKALGIQCKIDAQPIGPMLDKADAGDYDFWKGGHSASGVDVLNYAQQYVTGYFPGYFYADDEYDKLYKEAVSASTWDERKDLCFELEQYFCENVIDIILTQSMNVVVMNENVKNIKFAYDCVEYAYADID